MKNKIVFSILLLSVYNFSFAQNGAKPEDTEFYTPVPPVVTPGMVSTAPPSDAVVLFDGKNLEAWESAKRRTVHHGM